jgi:hypothetical protein
MAPTLRAQPDWRGAAETLIEGCASLPAGDARVRWLEQLCLALGDTLYPAFLRVLCLVGEHGEPLAQQAVAATLTEAMASGRLPAGRQAAWGGGAASRRAGPVEFLCAWYLQAGSAGALSASGFDRHARALLGLVGHDAAAQRLYRERLRAAAEDEMEGAWSRRDRAALLALATAWGGEGAPHAAAARAVDAFLQAAQRGEPKAAPWAGLCFDRLSPNGEPRSP